MRNQLFRDDLYYRLSVVHIQTPPLREVREDVPLLANHFLQKHCPATDLKHFAPAAMKRLVQCDWPGNARQLENEVKRLVVSVRGQTITEDQLSLQFQTKPEKSPATIQPKTGETLYQAVEALERKMIDEALTQADGNKHKAAELLGLSRQGLFKMLKRLGISSA